MEKKEYSRLKKMFIVGIIFSIVTVFGGEIPIGWVVNPEAENEIVSMIMGCGNLTLLQMACGVFFGGIGIPLQYYGYKAIGEIVEIGGCKKCGKLINIGAKAIAFWGGIVHIICVALMFVCRMENTQNLTQLPQSVIDFTLWLVLPFSVVFMAIYIPMTIAMLIPVIKGKTIFPKWAFIFNPIFFKIVLNAAAGFMPNTELMNGIRMSNMGLGSLVTFIGLLIFLMTYYKRKCLNNVTDKSPVTAK